jgi:tRNASer (uridine44-2'-O)-methyltransferase
LCHLFEFNNNSLDLYTEIVNKDADDKINLQIKWLEDNLMPKLVSWLNVKTDEFFTSSKLNTLTLYDNMVNDYVQLYQELKEIYFKLFESNWFEITNTSPEKYIHEDIAIACYFILAWKYLNVKVKKFIDIGCGNGLLVYILNDQGFNGYGVDMRRRRIWDNEHYINKKINLVEATINPQTDLFEDCDWLIGNHSDELSPWLPIIASKTALKTSLKCNFILIPCCFFDFFNKYDVKRNNESRYDTYLNCNLFILLFSNITIIIHDFLIDLESIFNICNFKVTKDKLRIPSTRNICFICQMHDVNDLENDKLDNLINQSANVFIPRDLELENKKSTRNCTKNVEFELKTYIVKTVMNKLLNESEQYLEKHDGSKWKSGQTIELNEIAKLFDQSTLNKLKQECGGIKTLLKNFHQLFEIVNKDKVKIKISKPVINESTSKYLKTKECLFEMYHPNGCLLSNIECSFIHLK